MPNLEKYSKADLIWVINQLCKHRFLSENYVRAALNELEYKKEMQRIESADRYFDIFLSKQKESAKLLKPYVGKLINDVPKAVLDRAVQALNDAERAKAMYLKLSKKID